MKLLVLLATIGVALSAQIYTFQQEVVAALSVDEQWELFKFTHGKTYEREEEETRRKEIFRNNLQKIRVHNSLHAQGLKSYTLGVNEYADMETVEFVRQMNGLMPRNATRGSTFLSPSNLASPEEVDWRKKGYVTEVKNQGHCGSCWAFSATGSLEGQHFKKAGKLVSLSEQNLVDCDKTSHGCSGGLMDLAFTYIKQNKGIDTEMSYPYEEKDGMCRYKQENMGAMDTGYMDIPHGNEDALKDAVATVGPISVGIDASHESFHLYKTGVYDEPMCSNTHLDHGVLAVGYGSMDNQDYWLVKNSWGTSWGMEGYIMMSRNKNNQCGIVSQASYPLV